MPHPTIKPRESAPWLSRRAVFGEISLAAKLSVSIPLFTNLPTPDEIRAENRADQTKDGKLLQDAYAVLNQPIEDSTRLRLLEMVS
ncbi:MAG: hypothetical protein E2O77_07415 [Caldithrix sp.]|nr:MAG: hypothetical protein E2O77_07415 [Caldithrix sp.]